MTTTDGPDHTPNTDHGAAADRGVDTSEDTPDLSGLSYEQARDELVEVVRALESGTASLAETMRLWERGEALARVCQTWLDGARERIEAAQAGASNPANSTNVE